MYSINHNFTLLKYNDLIFIRIDLKTMQDAFISNGGNIWQMSGEEFDANSMGVVSCRFRTKILHDILNLTEELKFYISAIMSI